MAVFIDVDADLAINDVNVDMARVSAQMGFWGDVWASAQEELTRADTLYRAWRALFTKNLLNDGSSLAEWKVKVEIESNENFVKYKQKIAEAERNVTLARTQFDAYETKSRTLQSKGAQMRATLDAPHSSPGRSTPYEETDIDTDDGVEESDSPVTADTRLSKMKAKGVFKRERS